MSEGRVRRRSRSPLWIALAAAGVVARGWPATRSALVRLLSQTRPNAARAAGWRISLGPTTGSWNRLTLAADLSQGLTEIVGSPRAAAAVSRFGRFASRAPHARFLDPGSPYYQAWWGAYVVLDAPGRRPFGFTEAGDVDLGDVLAVLEADQRLVFRSAGCGLRHDDGRAVRLHGGTAVERLRDGWSHVEGLAETWSVAYPGGHPDAPRRGRWIYGVLPADAPLGGFPRITVRGAFWIGHTPGATCAACVVAPDGSPILESATDLVGRVSFRSPDGRVTTLPHGRL